MFVRDFFEEYESLSWAEVIDLGVPQQTLDEFRREWESFTELNWHFEPPHSVDEK